MLVRRVVLGDLGLGNHDRAAQSRVVDQEVAELPLLGVGEGVLVGVVVRLGVGVGGSRRRERPVDSDEHDVERGALVALAVLALDVRVRDHDPGR